jgi:predicted DNA-binding transcriptional regulator AlpA
MSHTVERLAPSRMLSQAEVAEMFGVTKRTLRNWVAAGRFPRPVRPTRRTTLWDSRVIEAHRLALIEESNQ